MPDEKGNATQEDVNKLFTKLESGVTLFTSQVTARAEKAKTERVNGIAQLATKAGKDSVYTLEKLSKMSDESLEIVENSLNDLIKAMDNSPPPDGGSGAFNDRGAHAPQQVSNYELIDGLVDMVSHAFGLPILKEDEKQEVRFEHIAAGLEY